MPKKRDLASLRKKAEKLEKRALAKLKARLVKEAENDLKRVLKLVPDSVPTLNNLGSIYATYGLYDEATSYFKKALRTEKHNIFALAFLSVLHLFHYAEKETALEYTTRAYNYVISMDLDRFINYFEVHTEYLSMLIIALGLLDQHQKIIKLNKQFGLILYSFLEPRDILNIAIAYANEDDYDSALNLMESYEISNYEKYNAYHDLVSFLREQNISLKLDYITPELSLFEALSTPLWNIVASGEKGFFVIYYFAFSDKSLSELAWALLSETLTSYDKEVIIEILLATGRDDFVLFLETLLQHDILPLDLQISLYVLLVLSEYVMEPKDIKELKNEKRKEFVREYNNLIVNNEDLINMQNDFVLNSKLFDIYYSFYEKYQNHMIFLNLLAIVAVLTSLPEVSEKEKKKTLQSFVDKVIGIAKNARNPFYMLDIASNLTLIELSCKDAFNIILDALKLVNPKEQLPILYQTMLPFNIELLRKAECKEENISTIEKIVYEKKLIDPEKIDLIFAKFAAVGIVKLLRKRILSTKRLHKRYFEVTVTPDMRLTDLLANYNVSMLIGIAKYLQSKGLIKAIPRKKKMLIEELNTVIKSNVEKIIESFKEKKLKNAFEYLLKQQGVAEFDKFVAKFGSDKIDSIYWGYMPPSSILGKLKLSGVVFVGIYKNKKIIFIPKELLHLLGK